MSNAALKQQHIPEGHMRDTQGRLVPTEMVKEIDRDRDTLVREIVANALAQQTALLKFKTGAMGDIEAFIELSGEKYGAKVGGNKGNVTLSSFDGQYKVQRSVSEYIVFDERLQVAKTLIDECIHKWTEGSPANVKALVDHAFKTDAEGKVSTGRILGLKSLNIHDEKWLSAMQAISDSMRIAGSKMYMRVYERVGDSDQYQPISLDIAAL